MSQFLVLYMAPAAGLEEWMKVDPEVRKKEEDKMKAEWDTWMEAHKDMFKGPTAGAGKTKRVSKDGVVDTKNDIMLYAIVEGESHEAVAEAFKDHPHFGIPEAWIEIMPANYISQMQ